MKTEIIMNTELLMYKINPDPFIRISFVKKREDFNKERIYDIYSLQGTYTWMFDEDEHYHFPSWMSVNQHFI